MKANQIELQIRDYEHQGAAIIFMHFSGANLMMWQRVVPYFEDHYRLILVDLRGHGKSDKPETGYHIDEMARDVIGIMHHLKLDRAHIIGSSLGAEAGLSLAANYPDRVISLVCDGALSSESGPYGTWEGSEAEFEEHVASQLKKMRARPDTIFPSVDALVDATRQALGDWWNDYVEAMERYGAYKVDEGKYRKSLTRRAMADYMQHYFHCRFEDYYRRVRCPLLMVAGEDVLENEREKAAMEGLGELAQQAQIVTVSGWLHPYGWLLDPEGMCQAVLRFLGDTAH
ncbi:MAG: alpha/beta hydrolase [Anaerolineae bacterium]|nr:alpha/beta hydrolase [Anaerolineae bacterium]